ncbi:MAG: FG-GAP-like repeat-containing protein [bacterium]
MHDSNFANDCLGSHSYQRGWLAAMLFTLAMPGPDFAQNFILRTQSTGLALVARTNGVALADYDRDGDLDIYFVVQDSYDANDPRTWNRLFANKGDGTFSNVTTGAGLAGRDSNTGFSYMGYKMGAAWGDYDNDGWPDIFLTHFGPNQLFHNNGDGTFTDVTQGAGVAGGETQLSSSALWFDYDLDGDLDLYVSIWEDYTSYSRDKRNRMYENVGDGVFLNVSEASGLADKGQTWTTVAIDANNDDKLDLYVANDFGASHLYLNNGDKTFQERTVAFGLENNFHGMGLAIADCDANGYFDIYLTNVSVPEFDKETNPLFLNTGQNYFVNGSNEAGVSMAGWGWGTEFFDLENDGDDDLFVVTGNLQPDFANVLFRNASDSDTLHFERISHEVGLADSIVARGLAVFDYDEDGDPDLLISNFFAAPSLYENPMPHGNWLKVKLAGTVSNRDAFGAVVEVWANGKSYKKYHHGAQFLAQNIQPLHFGLSNAENVERLTVKWPSGFIEEIGAVDINQIILIKEKSGVVSGVRERSARSVTAPQALRLIGNYPNPFNSATQIRFELGVPGVVELSIADTQGQTVKAIRQSFTSIGEKSIHWDPTGEKAQPVSSGLYFYRLSLNGELVLDLGKLLYIK